MSDQPDFVCPCDGRLPAPPVNLPGLPHIDFRVGTFRELRRALLTPLPGEHALNGPLGPVWRPGGAGDLAVMIVEWWAYVADVLTFYNERIANQDYLRTADLPESVKRLIRLLGYRPRPAIGASGTLAALATPGQSATLPPGLQFQSKPGPGQEAQTFELDAATAIGAPDAVAAAPPTALLSPDPGILLLQGAVRSIAGGDLLLLRQRADATATPALVTVSQAAVETLAGGSQQTRLAVTLAGSVPPGLAAAQASLSRNNQSIGLWSIFAGAVSADGTTIQLASLARQIRAGDWVLFTAPSQTPALVQVTANVDMIWDATAAAATPTTPKDVNHPLPVLHSQLTIDPGLSPAATWDTARGAVSLRFDWIEVGRLKDQPSGAYTGSPASLLAIQPAVFPSGTDRPVIVMDAAGGGVAATATETGGGLALGSLPSPVPALLPPFNVLYNLLPVSRGKTVANEVIGSGDGAVAGQSFPLAKSPVTYLQKGATYASTIAITVDGQPWREVASFYDQPPGARIFVAREDDAGKTWVSFGDGINGARLPTGRNNVVATYRFGAGAASPPAGKLTVIAQSFPGLKSVLNPIAVSGGADADPADQIQRYAPRSVLTFGRAVSVFDYEALAAQAPDVTRARAAWSWDDTRQRTAVTVYVGDDAGAVASAKEVLAAAGDPNRPVSVVAATAIPLLIFIALVVTPGFDKAAITAGVKAALTDPKDGLFAPSRLRIGEPVFDSQIEAACLSVDGAVAIVASLLWDVGSFFDMPDPGPLHIPDEGAYFALSEDGVFIVTEPDPNA